MKKEELINQLQELPDGVEVLVLDPKKNMNRMDADGESGAGLYSNLLIKYLDEEDVAEGTKPFAVIALPTQDEQDVPENITCSCKPSEKHGETTVPCCNHCGLPTQPWWTNITISEGEYKLKEENNLNRGQGAEQ